MLLHLYSLFYNVGDEEDGCVAITIRTSDLCCLKNAGHWPAVECSDCSHSLVMRCSNEGWSQFRMQLYLGKLKQFRFICFYFYIQLCNLCNCVICVLLCVICCL